MTIIIATSFLKSKTSIFLPVIGKGMLVFKFHLQPSLLFSNYSLFFISITTLFFHVQETILQTEHFLGSHLNKLQYLEDWHTHNQK